MMPCRSCSSQSRTIRALRRRPTPPVQRPPGRTWADLLCRGVQTRLGGDRLEALVDPPSRGSRLDADHPENGVLIPRRFTFIWQSLQSPEVLSCGYEVEFVADTGVAERVTSGAVRPFAG